MRLKSKIGSNKIYAAVLEETITEQLHKATIMEKQKLSYQKRVNTVWISRGVCF